MHLQLLLALPAVASAALNCRPEGPVVPRPVISSLESSAILSAAASNLSSILGDALSGSIEAGWDTDNVSFSLALVSADQKHPGEPLWEYHHLADANTIGTSELTSDSQYLIGSVSKLISDYVLLQTGVDLDTPVTDLLPELKDPSSKILWGGITLRMLAEHLAGVPTNYGFSEYYYLKEVFLSLGFPPIKDSDYPPCGVTGLNGPCTTQQFLQGMLDTYPVTALNERASYSNVAFTIIFMALEGFTGKNYTELVQEYLVEPLQLDNTMPSPGEDAKAVIPPGESSWGADYGYNAPGGGLVSSLGDLTKLAHGILSRSIPMSDSDLRSWMKPSSLTGGQRTFVGMPWEIYRPVDLTPAHPHAVTVHSKGGGAVGYRAQWSLVDEYGVGVVVLTAGPPEALPILHGAMMSTFIPAVDEVSRADARDAYCRTFVSGRGGNSSAIVATISQDRDSLTIDSIRRGDSDITTGLLEMLYFTVGGLGFQPSPPLRLFPSDLADDTVQCHGAELTRESWRIWPDLSMESSSDIPGASYEADNCAAWTVSDWVHYGSEPLDRVVFYRDRDGQVAGFEVPFLRSGVLKPN